MTQDYQGFIRVHAEIIRDIYAQRGVRLADHDARLIAEAEMMLKFSRITDGFSRWLLALIVDQLEEMAKDSIEVMN